MSPRVRAFRQFIVVLYLFGVAASAFAGEPEAGPSGKAGGLLGFYQKYISPADGNRCPMYPSCSQYAHQCMNKHGLIIGWVMAMDRLVRCGRDERHISPTVVVSGSPRIYDPVENNDFWWDLE